MPETHRRHWNRFEWFRDGLIDGDDEVAGTYDPITYETSAIPLVNVRFGLDEFVKKQLITVNQQTAITQAIAQTPYDQRTEIVIRHAMEFVAENLQADLIRSVLHESGNVKRSDALLLLQAITSE